MWKKIKKTLSAIVASSLLITSTLTPINQAFAASGQVASVMKQMCSVQDCSSTVNVPIDQWTAVPNDEKNHPADLLSGFTDERGHFTGEGWMAMGQNMAGMMGLNTSEVALKSWQSVHEAPPWIVARYLAEKAELRISAMKTIKLADGSIQPYYTEYTPAHGANHVARRAFLSPSEKRVASAQGINPFERFSNGDPTDPVFYNVSLSASRVILSEAMAHYGTPYALMVDAQLRLHQEQHKKKKAFKTTITTYTSGFAKPAYHLAMPLAASPEILRNTPRPVHAYCPRGDGACTTPEQVAVANIFLQPVEGGLLDNTEQMIYHDVERKSGWNVLFFAVIAFFTFGASAAVGYMLANLVGGNSLSQPQKFFFDNKNLSGTKAGTAGHAECKNRHCSTLYERAQNKHIVSSNPMVDPVNPAEWAAGNLIGTKDTTTGGCSIEQKGSACGGSPGIAARSDTFSGKSYTAEFFEKRKAACVSKGFGASQSSLYRCMSRGVIID